MNRKSGSMSCSFGSRAATVCDVIFWGVGTDMMTVVWEDGDLIEVRWIGIVCGRLVNVVKLVNSLSSESEYEE